MPRNCSKDLIDEIEYLLPQELQKHKQIRQKFTNEEDILIIKLVGENQFPNWNEIAKSIPNKTSRQCRERFQNYLSPGLSKEPWTKEEDELIIRLYKEFGSSWSLIADYFGGRRTNNNIKNRWNSHLKSKFKESDISLELNILNKPNITNFISNTSNYISNTTTSLINYSSNSSIIQTNVNPIFHKNNQQILQKLVLMNQEPIIRREVQQKVIRQRQQIRIQNQRNEDQNLTELADCFNELVDTNTFNQDPFNTLDFIYNDQSDLDIFDN